MPYLAAAFQMTFQSDTDLYYYEPSLQDEVQVGHPTAGLYLGGNLGVGFEFRYKHHLSLHAELQGTGQGPVSIYSLYGYPKYLYSRFGLGIHLGLAWYF